MHIARAGVCQGQSSIRSRACTSQACWVHGLAAREQVQCLGKPDLVTGSRSDHNKQAMLGPCMLSQLLHSCDREPRVALPQALTELSDDEAMKTAAFSQSAALYPCPLQYASQPTKPSLPPRTVSSSISSLSKEVNCSVQRRLRVIKGNTQKQVLGYITKHVHNTTQPPW